MPGLQAAHLQPWPQPPHPCYPLDLATPARNAPTRAGRRRSRRETRRPPARPQAQDRAYRLGQRRDVHVYRLLATGTVEEMIYKRQVGVVIA